MSTQNTRGIRAHWPAYDITPLGIALAEASKFKRAKLIEKHVRIPTAEDRERAARYLES